MNDVIDSSYSIQLRLEHPRRDPNEITSALGMDPDRCWSAGSARTGPNGDALGGFNKENHWSKVLDADRFESGKFEAILLQLVSDVHERADFLKSFRADGGTVTLEAFWRIGSAWPQENLRHSLLGGLGGLGIDLVLIPILAEED